MYYFLGKFFLGGIHFYRKHWLDSALVLRRNQKIGSYMIENYF